MDFPPVDFCARLDPHAFAALVGAPPPVSVVSPVDDAHHGAPSADGVVLDDAPVRAKTKGAHNVVVALPAAPGKHSASALSSKGKLSEHYTLGHALGKGSFGQVFKARRVADGRSVAVKVISKGAFKKSTDHDILMNEVCCTSGRQIVSAVARHRPSSAGRPHARRERRPERAAAPRFF